MARVATPTNCGVLGSSTRIIVAISCGSSKAVGSADTRDMSNRCGRATKVTGSANARLPSANNVNAALFVTFNDLLTINTFMFLVAEGHVGDVTWLGVLVGFGKKEVFLPPG